MERKGYWAIVGSREVPRPILEVMIRLGRTLTDIGYSVSSGDAYDSDRAGWYGAKQSSNYDAIGSRIYLPNASKAQRIEKYGFIDASQFTDTWATARSMAASIHGAFDRMNSWGQDLHTRNVFQIHGHDMNSLVKGVFLYAKPYGKTQLSGGTNTAYQLAVNAKVETIKNLFIPEDLDWCRQFLEKYEKNEDYQPINWRMIHDPKDPRLNQEE